MIVLDTHVLLWLRAGDKKLGRTTRSLIEKAHLRSQVAVSAITFWEIAMLEDAGRIRLTHPVERFREAVIRDGVREIPLSGDIGIRAAQLLPAHGDPADRMLLATAAIHGAQFLTADSRLLTSPVPQVITDATQ